MTVRQIIDDKAIVTAFSKALVQLRGNRAVADAEKRAAAKRKSTGAPATTAAPSRGVKKGRSGGGGGSVWVTFKGDFNALSKPDATEKRIEHGVARRAAAVRTEEEDVEGAGAAVVDFLEVGDDGDVEGEGAGAAVDDFLEVGDDGEVAAAEDVEDQEVEEEEPYSVSKAIGDSLAAKYGDANATKCLVRVRSSLQNRVLKFGGESGAAEMQKLEVRDKKAVAGRDVAKMKKSKSDLRRKRKRMRRRVQSRMTSVVTTQKQSNALVVNIFAAVRKEFGQCLTRDFAAEAAQAAERKKAKKEAAAAAGAAGASTPQVQQQSKGRGGKKGKRK